MSQGLSQAGAAKFPLGRFLAGARFSRDARYGIAGVRSSRAARYTYRIAGRVSDPDPYPDPHGSALI